ncbi:unnamed protein product [Vitrella brassicaformis CCMP3155]|uniref:K Homology domain-containing protein n=2 Tax=Vitrella brassicaformis TaxID=1169539 RepID=A0A0G4EBH7_VITBC|nr:unnamed protein product [Vitrella brassicaformis CCMP3155]|eukprot:CEL92627.1 unnamed protein product [Vitrella brassicaformis CCMP3155]
MQQPSSSRCSSNSNSKSTPMVPCVARVPVRNPHTLARALGDEDEMLPVLETMAGGAKIDFAGRGRSELVISGDGHDQVDKARTYLLFLLDNAAAMQYQHQNQHNNNNQQQQNQLSHTLHISKLTGRDDVSLIPVPNDAVGLVMGKRGETLRQISKSHTVVGHFVNVKGARSRDRRGLAEQLGEPEIPGKPACEGAGAGQLLVLWGQPLHRLGAEFHIYSMIEKCFPGKYFATEYIRESKLLDHIDGLAVDKYVVPEDIGCVLKHREQVGRAARCVINNIGDTMLLLAGTKAERARGRYYADLCIRVISNSKGVTDEDVKELQNRDDVSILETTSPPAMSLSDIEQLDMDIFCMNWRRGYSPRYVVILGHDPTHRHTATSLLQPDAPLTHTPRQASASPHDHSHNQATPPPAPIITDLTPTREVAESIEVYDTHYPSLSAGGSLGTAVGGIGVWEDAHAHVNVTLGPRGHRGHHGQHEHEHQHEDGGCCLFPGSDDGLSRGEGESVSDYYEDDVHDGANDPFATPSKHSSISSQRSPPKDGDGLMGEGKGEMQTGRGMEAARPQQTQPQPQPQPQPQTQTPIQVPKTKTHPGKNHSNNSSTNKADTPTNTPSPAPQIIQAAISVCDDVDRHVRALADHTNDLLYRLNLEKSRQKHLEEHNAYLESTCPDRFSLPDAGFGTADEAWAFIDECSGEQDRLSGEQSRLQKVLRLAHKRLTHIKTMQQQ